MELREYWHIIRKRILMVLFIPIISALVTGYYVMHKPQLYQVQETMLMDETGLGSQGPDTVTYVGVLQSKYFTDQMNQEMGTQYTLSDLQSVNYSFSGQLMIVSVVTTNPIYATKLLNTVANVADSTTNRLIPGINGGQVINPPSTTTVALHQKRDIILSFVMALIAGLGLSFLREYLDMRIKTELDLVRFLSIPSLGSVHKYKTGKSND